MLSLLEMVGKDIIQPSKISNSLELFFYKVFTEIGSLGFTEFGRASTRTDASK